MRLASYLLSDGTGSYGLVDGSIVRDASPQLRARYADLTAFVLGRGTAGDFEGAHVLPLEQIVLLPPVKLGKTICVGLNYSSHILETGRDIPTHPSIFTRYPASMVAHGQPLIAPRASSRFDFEGELAVVIGTAGRRIASDRAMAHIAGYTCFNDGSIRDFQRHTTQFWPGKNFDKTGSVGPFLLTSDEISDIDKECIVTRLNGVEMQRAHFSDLAIKIPALIEYISSVCELLPGDIIATGTPGGVGAFRNPPVFMKPGDVIEVEISRVGTLSNIIEAELA